MGNLTLTMRLRQTTQAGPCAFCQRMGKPTQNPDGSDAPLHKRSMWVDSRSNRLICESCILHDDE